MKPISCGIISTKSGVYHNFRWDLSTIYVRTCDVSYIYSLRDALQEVFL